MPELQIRQTKSMIGAKQGQRRTLAALGLGSIGRESVRPDTSDVRAMVAVVQHLVEVKQGNSEGDNV
ncbi:MAG TPA: 50S ribosomal protein L30 [Chloroflexi bacterium]|nr:50S ribosomal protein L30 [Chloroflexota bacterium]|tara:strand:+ start:4926 stop:5126 length:201 start_codon:yes stop_codon:yes gene_type:complete